MTGTPICVWPYELSPPAYRELAGEATGDNAGRFVATVPSVYAGDRLRDFEFWFADALPMSLPGGELMYAGTLPAAIRVRRRWLSPRRFGAARPEPPISIYPFDDAPEEYREVLARPGQSDDAFLVRVPARYQADGYRPLWEFVFGRAEQVARASLPGGDELCVGVMPDRSLYQRLGGEASIKAVVDHFYDRVLADGALSHYFSDVDMPRQRGHLAAFVIAATGGPKVYAGRDLREAHQPLSITGADYDRVIGHLANTLSELGVSSGLVAEVAAALSPLRPLIVADGLNGSA